VSTPPHKLDPAEKIGPVLDELEERFGPRERSGEEDPLEVLVRGVLSQNTSDVNSGRAYRSLREEFPTWQELAEADRAEVTRAIRSGGLAEQKARTIEAIMDWLAGRDGFGLEFLEELDPEEAEDRLTAIKGVGVKTARLVLLFGFGWPCFVVDTHVLRVSRRLGLIPENCGRVKAHRLLDEIVPDCRAYGGHLNMIQHGRQICTARSPDCPRCPVSRWCLYVRDQAA
jgi:endonuclease-3